MWSVRRKEESLRRNVTCNRDSHAHALGSTRSNVIGHALAGSIVARTREFFGCSAWAIYSASHLNVDRQHEYELSESHGPVMTCCTACMLS